MNRCELVRKTCLWVQQQASHVALHSEQFAALPQFYYKPFDHYEGHSKAGWSQQDTLRFLFTLDCANFCFWPKPDYEYADLCQSIKALSDLPLASLISCADSDLLEGLPQREARLACIQEVTTFVSEEFNGSFIKLVESAGRSAVKLLNTITRMACFQDHCIYRGRQVFLYKRAQLLISDIFGAFHGKGLGEFADIDQLTMFADYRVPQLLRELGVMSFSPQLQSKILRKEELQSGSQEEVEIRALTVVAVEQLKEWYRQQGRALKSCEIDWFLWQVGQLQRKEIFPHHRVRTIYY